METFGCCSSYLECSDALRCIHAGDPGYEGCNYRKRLEAGKVFYGKNAGKVVQKKQDNTEIYLTCYRNPFAVFSRHKNTFSYKLNPEQFNAILTRFDDYGIPYCTELDLLTEIDGKWVKDNSPANSRVVFELEGQEYNILNFNSYLMQNYYAEMICKAFKAKGIESRVEIIGTYAGYRPHVVVKQQKQEQEVKKEQDIKPIQYEQISIFSLMTG